MATILRGPIQVNSNDEVYLLLIIYETVNAYLDQALGKSQP